MNAYSMTEKRRALLEAFGFSEEQLRAAPDPSEFLSAAYLKKVCAELGYPQDFSAALVSGLALFETPFVKAALGLCRQVFFADTPPAERGKRLRAWPMLEEADEGPGAGLFYAYLFLSGLDFQKAFHQRLGIPFDVTRAGLADLEIWARREKNLNGVWRLVEKGWVGNHFSGNLFQLGRLQFQKEKFPYDFRVYRRKNDGAKRMFAAAGMVFRQDGQFNGANEVNDPNAWTATFEEKDNEVRGSMIAADGKARQEIRRADKTEWELALSKDDLVLGIHIPDAGPMTYDACRDAFFRALAFFPKHFPDYPFQAFTCGSWILDNQFLDLLPESSNMRRFQRQVYLFPLPKTSDKQTFERVFGRQFANIDDAPTDNSLRRLIVEHVKKGGYWRQGGCVLFPDDLRGERAFPIA